jgi:hypothetical protein
VSITVVMAAASDIEEAAEKDLSNIDLATFLAKGMAAGLAAYGVIDPHEAAYGAKGDAFSCGDAVVTTTSSTGDTISTAQRDFIASDIGKKLWIGTSQTERTITAISGTAAIFSPAYGSTGSNLQMLCGTDDTAAIQAALNAAGTNAITGKVGVSSSQPFTYVRGGIPIGKTVKLRSGCGYIVGNTAAQYDAGKKSALILRRRTGFIGAGVSFFGSALHLKPGSKGHVVANENPEALTDYADFLTIGNFTIYCYKDTWNPLSLDGFKLSVAADGFSKVDGFNRILAMHVYAAGRDGISLAGRGEFMGFDLNGFYCGRNGVRTEGLADSRIYHAVAAGNDKAGVVAKGGGPVRFIGGKSYYNGATGGSVDEDSCNVLIDTDNEYAGVIRFTDFEAQESRGSAWIIKARCKLVGCDAFDPGREPLGGGSLPDDIAGFKLKTVNANNVVFEACSVEATLTNFSGSPGNLGSAKWGLWIEDWGASGGPSHCRGDISVNMTVTKPDATTIAGVSFAVGGGITGGGGTTNGRNNGLRVNGLTRPRVVTSGNVTALLTDSVIVVNKSVGSATAVTLPASPATGQQITIKDGKGDANANNITITPAAGTIDGAATLVMNVNRQSVTLMYSGSEWCVI